MKITTSSVGFETRPFKPQPVVRMRFRRSAADQFTFEDFFGGEFDDVSENDNRLIVTDYEFPMKLIGATFDSRFGGCNVSLRWNGNLVDFDGAGTVVFAPISPSLGEYTCSQMVPVLGELTLDIFDINPLYDGSEIVDWFVFFLRPPG